MGNDGQELKPYGEQGNPAYRTLAEQGIRNAALEEAIQAMYGAFDRIPGTPDRPEYQVMMVVRDAIRALKT